MLIGPSEELLLEDRGQLIESGVGQIFVPLAAQEPRNGLFDRDENGLRARGFLQLFFLGIIFRLQLTLEIFSLFPLRVLALRRMKRPSDPSRPLIPLGAAAALVVDVVGRAGRIVSGVNRKHGISTFAKSVVRSFYGFFLLFSNYCIISRL